MLRQHTTILMVALMMLPQLIWAIQWGPNGQPSDVFYDAQQEPSYILVIQDKAPVFNTPDDSTKVMQASFGMARYIADKVTHHEKTYYLMVDFDSENWTIKKFLGWISADSVLRDLKPLTEKGIALKGLIIRKSDAYKGPNSSYDFNKTINPFDLFFAFSQKNGYTLIAQEATLPVENAENQLFGWVADNKLHLWKTRQAIEFDKTTVERRKLGVKVFETQQDAIDFYFHDKKIVPLAEEDLKVKTPWDPNQMRYPIISAMTHPTLGLMYKISIISEQKSIFQPGWVTVNDPETGIRQVREMLLISRYNLESYVGFLSAFVKTPISRRMMMAVWKRTLEINLGETELNKPVSDLLQITQQLPVKTQMMQKIIRCTLCDTNKKFTRGFRQNLYKSFLYLRSFLSEENIEVVEDHNSRFGWKPIRKGTRKVWWKFSDTVEYCWIPLDLMP